MTILAASYTNTMVIQGSFGLIKIWLSIFRTTEYFRTTKYLAKFRVNIDSSTLRAQFGRNSTRGAKPFHNPVVYIIKVGSDEWLLIILNFMTPSTNNLQKSQFTGPRRPKLGF